MILTLSLTSLHLSLAVAFLHYDQERYQYEDRLISSDGAELEVRALPLNYRLPQLPSSPPTFLSPGETNMTAVVGSTVVLACRVTSLGTSSVSWLRLPQLTVLSSGGQVFSSSPRVSVIHSEDSPDYNLQISSVSLSDSGQYHCQLNTRPARSVLVNLRVRPGQNHLVPALALRAHTANTRTRTEILAPDLVTDTEGGTVTLECVVTEHDNPPTRFTWYILGAPLDFSKHRGGILLHNEKKIRSSSSKLTITKLLVSDSGEYTCAPHGVSSKTVHLQVNQIKRRRSFNLPLENGSGVSPGQWRHLAILLAFTTVIRFV